MKQTVLLFTAATRSTNFILNGLIQKLIFFTKSMIAHPGFIIEQYVYQFLSQWHVGLPSLTLQAKSNGEIAVSLNLITSFHSASFPSNHDEDQPFNTPPSRSRRRVRRAAGGKSKETHEASIFTPAESEQDQCTHNTISADPPDSAELPMSLACDTSLPLASNLSHHATQEPQRPVGKETMSKLLQSSMEEPPVVQCSLCQNHYQGGKNA